jgi:hypothetical protein
MLNRISPSPKNITNCSISAYLLEIPGFWAADSFRAEEFRF